MKRYSVIHYNSDQTIKRIYENTNEAAYELKLSVKTVYYICRGSINNTNYILKYGNKIVQPRILNYPEYEIIPLIKEAKPKKQRIKTRTRTTVNEYVNNILVNSFNSVVDAARFYNMKENKIFLICRGKNKKKINIDLRFGEKKQNEIN